MKNVYKLSALCLTLIAGFAKAQSVDRPAYLRVKNIAEENYDIVVAEEKGQAILRTLARSGIHGLLAEDVFGGVVVVVGPFTSRAELEAEYNVVKQKVGLPERLLTYHAGKSTRLVEPDKSSDAQQEQLSSREGMSTEERLAEAESRRPARSSRSSTGSTSHRSAETETLSEADSRRPARSSSSSSIGQPSSVDASNGSDDGSSSASAKDTVHWIEEYMQERGGVYIDGREYGSHATSPSVEPKELSWTISYNHEFHMRWQNVRSISRSASGISIFGRAQDCRLSFEGANGAYSGQECETDLPYERVRLSSGSATSLADYGHLLKAFLHLAALNGADLSKDTAF